MTPDPLDPTVQAEWRELDKSRRIPDCTGPNCLCRQDDAMTTPLDPEDYQ